MGITVDLGTIVGQIRLEIGDDVDGNGVRPNGRHFEDAALLHFYTIEGGDTSADPDPVMVGRAAARACEMLARDWAKVPVTQTLGPATDTYSKTIEGFAAQARELRRRFGSSSPQAAAPFVVPGGTTDVTVMPYSG